MGRTPAAHAPLFTRLRLAPGSGSPGPVRSRQHIYGLPGNSRAQQAEADRGTLLACNSPRRGARRGRGWQGEARHLREPPETDHPSAGSIYYLPEVVKWISQKGTEYADFNACVYADPDKGETRRLTRSRKGSWAAFRIGPALG